MDINCRTSEYVAHDNHIPPSGNGHLEKDKLLRIWIEDFAITIVDEAETGKDSFEHWRMIHQRRVTLHYRHIVNSEICSN